LDKGLLALLLRPMCRHRASLTPVCWANYARCQGN